MAATVVVAAVRIRQLGVEGLVVRPVATARSWVEKVAQVAVSAEKETLAAASVACLG